MELVQGYCSKHKTGDGSPMPKIDRGGESICMFCESDLSPKTGITSHTSDPGDEELRRVLARSGVAVPPSTGKAPHPEVPRLTSTVKPASSVITPVITSFEGQIKQALNLLKNLPMPSDVKQFKAIQKIIIGMEGLLGEK